MRMNAAGSIASPLRVIVLPKALMVVNWTLEGEACQLSQQGRGRRHREQPFDQRFILCCSLLSWARCRLKLLCSASYSFEPIPMRQLQL